MQLVIPEPYSETKEGKEQFVKHVRALGFEVDRYGASDYIANPSENMEVKTGEDGDYGYVRPIGGAYDIAIVHYPTGKKENVQNTYLEITRF